VDLAEQNEVIIRKGAWYSYNGENISQGRDNAIKLLEEKPELAKEIESLVRQKMELKRGATTSEVTAEDEDDLDDVSDYDD
jgi:recombination protein RecA